MDSKSKTLKEVCEIIIDCEHKTAPTQSFGYPSIRTPNIGKGRLILDGVNRVSEETYRQWTQRGTPKTADLILAREAPIGNVAIIPSNLKVCLGQRTVLIRPNRNYVVPNYLVYLMLGDEIQAKIHSLSNGATVHHFNMVDIRNLELPNLPSLPTQRKIADILSAYDDLIENNTRRIAILEEMAQSLYQEWFVKFRFPGHEKVGMVESEMGRVPEGWRIVKFSEWAEISRVGIDPNKFKGEIFIYYSIPAFDEGHMPLREVGDNIKSNKFLIPKGALLLSKLNPRIPRIWLPTDTDAKRVVASTEFIVLLPKPPFSRDFIYSYCSSLDFIEKFAAKAIGTSTSHQRAKSDDLMSLMVVSPGQETLKKFIDLISANFKIVDSLRLKNANLRQTRDLLLPKLISGEIDVSSWVEEEGEGGGEEVSEVMVGKGVRRQEVAEPIDREGLVRHSLWE